MESQPLAPGLSALPPVVEHQPGGMAEAVRAAVCDGVLAQAPRAPALKMPMMSALIMTR